jgi:hypothetical protein
MVRWHLGRERLDKAYFPTAEGSMTSEDGQTFMLM